MHETTKARIELEENQKAIKEYMARIGRKGGQNSKRTDMAKGSPGQAKAQAGRRKNKGEQND